MQVTAEKMRLLFVVMGMITSQHVLMFIVLKRLAVLVIYLKPSKTAQLF